MALTHQNDLRNTLAAAVRSAVDAGSANPAGVLVFVTEADAAVATLEFSNPAFTAPTDGVIEALAIGNDTNAVGGEVTAFVFRNRDGTEVLRGTVTGNGGGGDIEMSSTTVGAGDTISMSFLSYEASE